MVGVALGGVRERGRVGREEERRRRRKEENGERKMEKEKSEEKEKEKEKGREIRGEPFGGDHDVGRARAAAAAA